MPSRPCGIALLLTVVASSLAACDRDGRSSSAKRYTKALGVKVEDIAGEEHQYLIHGAPGCVNFSVIGEVREDLGYAVAVTLPDGGQVGFRFSLPPDGPSAEELSKQLGVRVTQAPGEVRQYLVHAPVEGVDFSKVGTVHQNLGYAVGVTLSDGMEIGFRFAGPTAQELTELLGVRVSALTGEAQQYLVHSRRGAVDLGRVGKIHSDLGYAVGVTLRSGLNIGFRFSGPSAQEISAILGLEVDEIPREASQYLVYARRAGANIAKLGSVHVDAGDNVGVTLADGTKIGLRFAGPSAAELSEALGVKVTVIREEVRQYWLFAAPGTVDFSKVGRVHLQEGMNVGVTLSDGGKIGFRYARSSQASK